MILCGETCIRHAFTLSNINSVVPGDTSGVYAFWFRDYCIYVGKAADQSLRKRLKTHWEKSHNAELTNWIKAKPGELRISFRTLDGSKAIARFEKFYIRRFNPLTNKIRYES